MPTPKPPRSVAPNPLPIQFTPFSEKHFSTPEGIAFVNQFFAQVINALNRGTGQGGPVVLPAGINVAGAQVSGVGKPKSESDAVPLGHAEGNYSASAVSPQLDIGGSNTLKGLAYLFLQKYVNQIIAGANITIDPADGTGIVTINATGGGGGGITELTGDVDAGPGSGSVAATVVGVNGASLPTSKAYVGTNGSGQIVAATTPVTPNNTPSTSHEWFDAYDSSTGAFTKTQPDFTDISGVAATDQIGTGTPSSGEYVDGGTGAWTSLPSSGSVELIANEVVSGTGTAFTLANTPVSGTVALYNGAARLWPTVDYTISGASITMNYSLSTGALLADYVTSISGSTYVANEVVGGTGTSFTLANSPVLGTVSLYSGSGRLWPTTDYTISGANITMNYSVSTGGLLADYLY